MKELVKSVLPNLYAHGSRAQRWRRHHRGTEFVVKYKFQVGKCENCGWNENPFELTFHHLYNRTRAIAYFTSKGRKKLLREIGKCRLLCRECHDQEHGILRYSTVVKELDSIIDFV